jgi:hypothetical protein
MARTHVGIASFALLIGASFAKADLVTFTESVTASGSLGSTPFTDKVVTLTATGDTSNVTNPSLGVFYLPGLVVSINITGLGTAVLTDVGEISTFQGGGYTGFRDESISGEILDTVRNLQSDDFDRPDHG